MHPAFAIISLSTPVVAITNTSQPSLRSPPVFVPPEMVDPSAKPVPTPSPPMSAHAKVPFQLVLTAKNGSLADLPKKMGLNLGKTLALNPGLQVRFLNDAACRDFIALNFKNLLPVFNAERRGAYRGDICRAAVIALEGGFYADLDVQFRVPLSQLADDSTTFMTSFDVTCNALNAVFAAEPGSEVMRFIISAILQWYEAPSHPPDSSWMGTKTMLDGMAAFVARSCPWVDLKSTKLQFGCGLRQQFRLYREKRLLCDTSVSKAFAWTQTECPPTRSTGFSGAHFGIFEPGPERNLVAWSRFEDCTKWGCNERRTQQACSG